MTSHSSRNARIGSDSFFATTTMITAAITMTRAEMPIITFSSIEEAASTSVTGAQAIATQRRPSSSMGVKTALFSTPLRVL